jgi:hypothetical protein
MRLAALLIALALLIPPPARAADDLKLAESIPVNLADVVTGGSWSEGSQGGFYRALVVMSGEGDKFGAKVFVQWLAISDESPVPTIVKTVPIAEINGQGLANAALEFEGEDGKDNEMTIVVNSYDFEKEKDLVFQVKAQGPGTYNVQKAPDSAPDGAPNGSHTPATEGPKGD